MGSTGYDRPSDAAECRFCLWVISARGSGHLVDEEDCAAVRASGEPRPPGTSARWRRTRGEQRRKRAPRLGKREFPSITLSAVSCCIASAYPETSAAFLPNDLRGCLRPCRLGDAAIGENGAFDPLQFGNVSIEVQQAIFGPAHLGLALSKSGGLLRQPGLVLISIRTRQNRRRCSRLLKALAESGFFALGSRQSFANRAFDGC